jgi:hypothetical protein
MAMEAAKRHVSQSQSHCDNFTTRSRLFIAPASPETLFTTIGQRLGKVKWTRSHVFWLVHNALCKPACGFRRACLFWQTRMTSDDKLLLEVFRVHAASAACFTPHRRQRGRCTMAVHVGIWIHGSSNLPHDSSIGGAQ